MTTAACLTLTAAGQPARTREDGDPGILVNIWSHRKLAAVQGGQKLPCLYPLEGCTGYASVGSFEQQSVSSFRKRSNSNAAACDCEKTSLVVSMCISCNLLANRIANLILDVHRAILNHMYRFSAALYPCKGVLSTPSHDLAPQSSAAWPPPHPPPSYSFHLRTSSVNCDCKTLLVKPPPPPPTSRIPKLHKDAPRLD